MNMKCLKDFNKFLERIFMKTHILKFSRDLTSSLDIEFLRELEKLSKDELIEKLLEKTASSKKRLLGKDEILKMFNIPKQRFEHLVRENKIPHIFINNKLRLFNPDEVYDCLNTHFKIA